MRRPSHRRIAGAGGGGGGKGGSSGGGTSRAAVEAADNLRSKQYARVVDLISEGEIGGLVNGLRSVYLDDTPIQNADGSYNFQGVTLDTRTGTQSQAYIAGFQSSESEQAVSAEIKAPAAVVRTISSGNINAARVTISIPALTYQDTTTGDLSGTSVQIAIDVQANGGGYVQKINDTISGKTSSRYQRSYRVELSGTPPWDIRVRRLTADTTAGNIQNKTWFDSYTEIIDAKLRYPNSAICALQVDASQFRGIPKRGYEIKGIKLQLPSNYNPTTRAYTGAWDGTFQVAWSDNPAWVFYDMITNTRYGLGEFVDAAQVDKWALYEIARYCDELVSDGFGAQEPRLTCNLYLQTREEAYKVVTTLASVFRGIGWWSAGAVTAAQDKPSDPVAQFTSANVINGEFSYAGSSLKARHTVALVSYNDPADHYRQKIEYVEDQAGIARYGVIQVEVAAVGCTSRGQAHRLGRWLQYSERLETETVTFRAGLDGTFVHPGAVIQTLDPFRAGKRFGGRVVAATAGSMTIDAAVTIESGKSYTLSCVMPDGTVESHALNNSPGSTAVLTLDVPFSQAPQAQSVWVLAASDLVPELWRVVAMTEAEKTQIEITALKHNPGKYLAVEQNLLLEPLQTSVIGGTPQPVTGVSVTESLYLVALGVVGVKVFISWSGNAPRYEIGRRLEAGNWTFSETTTAAIDIPLASEGVYEFAIVAMNALGLRSTAVTVTQEIFGKTVEAADITGFTAIATNGACLASWNLHPDLDVNVGGAIVIRHTPETVAPVWANSVILDTFAGAAVSGTVPLISGTLMAKAVDSSGNYSYNFAAFQITEGMVSGFNTVGTSTQSPTFTGAKTNVEVDSLVGLRLSSLTLFDDQVGNIDDWQMIDWAGDTSPTGSYAFDAVMDLGSVKTRRFEADITAHAWGAGDWIDARLENVDDWGYVDADEVNDCDVTLYAAITDDDPSGSPAWSPWAQFFVADFNCRAAKFRMDFLSGNPKHNIAVSNLVVHAKEII